MTTYESKRRRMFALAAIALVLIPPLLVLAARYFDGAPVGAASTDAAVPVAHRAANAAAPAPHTLPEPDHGENDVALDPHVRVASFTPPRDDDIPDNAFGAMVRQGRDIFVDTQTHAAAYVGNGLRCANCHLGAGRKPGAGPLWAAYVKYPAYRDKNKRVNSFEDRIAGCFTFSMNGRSPPYDSPEMVALVSYSYWLAQGAPVGADLPGRGYAAVAAPPQPPEAARGTTVYADHCAACHGAKGEGSKANGRYVFPPLWGMSSYNAGAGMARVATAAAFIKANMPLGMENSLTDQQAWDVAQFVNSHARPADPRTR
jgi:thiosulfate dehydrogenase